MNEQDRSKRGGGDRRRDLPLAGSVADDGVDVTLIRWFLGLTPAERLDALQRNVDTLIELRRGRAGS
jgi:hypothetical protein